MGGIIEFSLGQCRDTEIVSQHNEEQKGENLLQHRKFSHDRIWKIVGKLMANRELYVMTDHLEINTTRHGNYVATSENCVATITT